MIAHKPQLEERLERVRLLAMDVDGVLTDGSIFYSTNGDELREFNVADGLGLVLLQIIGVEVAWITGKTSSTVERRAAELDVKWLKQGVHNKGAAIEEIRASLRLSVSETAYIGDDWNDLLAYEKVGVKIATSNAHTDIKAIVDAVTERSGGYGAVREAADAIIDAKGERERAWNLYIERLRNSSAGVGQ